MCIDWFKNISHVAESSAGLSDAENRLWWAGTGYSEYNRLGVSGIMTLFTESTLSNKRV